MADASIAAIQAALAQQPQNATSGAPGTANNMPPPSLPPLNTSQMNSGDVQSPMSAGGTVRRAAPEPNKRALYVGGLDPRVTEDVLRQIFETAGHVQNVKIIPDKNVCHPDQQKPDALGFPGYPPLSRANGEKFQSKGYNYGFIDFDDPAAAERAMQTLNGRHVHGNV